jgi:hypothetical protein
MRDQAQGTGAKADVFSAGIVLAELSSGESPAPSAEMRGGRAVPEAERRRAYLAAI